MGLRNPNSTFFAVLECWYDCFLLRNMNEYFQRSVNEVLIFAKKIKKSEAN